MVQPTLSIKSTHLPAGEPPDPGLTSVRFQRVFASSAGGSGAASTRATVVFVALRPLFETAPTVTGAGPARASS
jgi:hypothetical protein